VTTQVEVPLVSAVFTVSRITRNHHCMDEVTLFPSQLQSHWRVSSQQILNLHRGWPGLLITVCALVHLSCRSFVYLDTGNCSSLERGLLTTQ